MKAKKLVIVGLGETAILAYEYFTKDSSYDVVAFSVNQSYIKEDTFLELPVIPFETIENVYSVQEVSLFVAMGSGQLNYLRTKLYKECKVKGYTMASYISSKAFVWDNVEIGENCFILEDNTLQPFVRIGNNVTMWSGNHLGHRSIIHDNCFITSHVVISGFCEIGENTFMGVNSSVADNVIIGKDNLIGMGCCINKQTTENSLYITKGTELAKVPAKMFARVEE